MKRLVAVVGVALLAAALGAGVAEATATLDKASVPGNADVDIVLELSVEELVGYNQKVILTVPEGFTALACTQPEGFKCSRSTATNPTRSLITWENTNPAPIEFGITPTTRFPFKIKTIATTGDYPFPVDQYYSNGERTNWNGGPGTTNKAPILKVAGQNSSVVTNPPEPTPPSDNSSSDTTTPSFTPPFDSGTATTVVFDNPSTPTTAADTTATTLDNTTDSTFTGSLAAGSGGGGGKGIEGLERAVLLALAVLFVGLASVTTLKQRV